MLWVAVAAPFLLIGLAALISASQRWEMQREVRALAAAAARAGAQSEATELRFEVVLGSAAPRPVVEDPVRRRVAAVAAQDPGVVVVDVTVDVVDPPATVPDPTLSVVAKSVSVELRAPIDYAFPLPGFPRSVTGRATAVAVEAAG